MSVLRRLLGGGPEVEAPTAESSDPAQFFSSVDRFQRDAYRTLKRSYPKPDLDSFCKLVALKAANAFAADYHFRNRHAALISRPMQLQMDPTNACQLQCPSCLHTANDAWGRRFDWPRATLSVADFTEFCSQFGPYATGIALFRDGEPLLHRSFPDFVATAKSYLLYTLSSTNLSMPIDAEALVSSGLDRLVAAIDGASAATYSRYRKGGDFDLVLDNLRAIVRARKAQSSLKPWLVWQFLAFEHNVHEIPLAEKLAREIGIDQLVISRPHSVTHDDPSIRVAESAPFGETVFTDASNWCGSAERASASRHAERIDQVFQQSWAVRHGQSINEAGWAEPAGAACPWLYYSLTMDAAMRITPCCLPAMGSPEPRRLVYSRFGGGNADELVDSPDAMLARRLSRSGSRVETQAGGGPPYCLICTDRPQPPFPPDISGYLRFVDDRNGLPEGVHAALARSPLFAWPLL